MSNEVYEFLLKLSAAGYRSGLGEGKQENKKFDDNTKKHLGNVQANFDKTDKKVAEFAKHYKASLRGASDATSTFESKIRKSTGNVSNAFDSLGRHVEQRLLKMTTNVAHFGTAMHKLNSDTSIELKGIAQKMIVAAADTDAYSASLKSLNASARNTAKSLAALNAQQAAGSAAPPSTPAAPRSSAPSSGAGGAAAGAAAASFGRQVRSESDEAVAGLKNLKTELGEAASGSRVLATTAIGALAAVGAAIVGTGKAFGDYEAILKRLESVTLEVGKSTAQTKAEMLEFQEVSFKLGTSTQFSAKAIGLAGVELAKLGYTTKEVISVLPGVVSAAAAGQVELAKAAEYVTAALKGFGLQARDSTHVADLFSRAAAMSAIDFRDLGETFKYASSIAKSSSQPIEEMTALIAIMGNNMIKGSMAGTSLRQALIALQRPTKAAREVFDILKISPKDEATGKLKNLSVILKELSSSLEGVDETSKNAAVSAIFGREAMSGMLAIMNQGPEEIDRFIASMKDVDNASKQMADIAFSGLNAEFTKMTAAIETASIKFGEVLAPQLTNVIQELKAVVLWLDHLPVAFKESIGGALILTAKLAALIAMTAGARAGLSTLTRGLLSFVGIQSIAAARVAATTLALKISTAAIIAYNGSLAAGTTRMRAFGASAVAASGVLTGTFWKSIGIVTARLVLLAGAIKGVQSAWETFQASVDTLANEEASDNTFTDTLKDREKAIKAYQALKKKFDENPDQTPEQMLKSGKLKPAELMTGAAGLQMLANQHKDPQVSQAWTSQADIWRRMVNQFTSAKQQLADLRKAQQEFVELQRSLQSEEFKTNRAQMTAELAAKRKKIAEMEREARQNGFTNLQTLDQIMALQKEMDAKSAALDDATQRGREGDGKDERLEQLNREYDLMKRNQDLELGNLDIKDTAIQIQTQQTAALKSYRTEFELLAAITGHSGKNAIGRGAYTDGGTFGLTPHDYEARDWLVPTGTPIKAPWAGTINYAGMSGTDGVPGIRKGTGYGNLITMDFGKGYTGNFGHLSKMVVKPGQRVNQGDVIGYSGGELGAHGSGNSSGAHLHLDLSLNGEKVDINDHASRITGAKGNQVEATIDLDKLNKRNAIIQRMITERKAKQAAYLKEGYTNEAAKVGQDIQALQDEIKDNIKAYNAEQEKLSDDRQAKLEQANEKVVQTMTEFKEDMKQIYVDMARDNQQFSMTEAEREADNAGMAVAALEKRIAKTKDLLNNSNASDAVKDQARKDLLDLESLLKTIIEGYSLRLARISVDAGEDHKQILDQISAYETLMAQALERQEEATANGLENFIQRAIWTQAGLDVDKYKKKLEELNKQRTKYYKDQKDAEEKAAQRQHDAEKDRDRQQLIEEQERRLDKGPEEIMDANGNVTGYKTVDLGLLKNLYSDRKAYLQQQLKDMSLVSVEEQKSADYQARKKELNDEIAKIVTRILFLETGITQESIDQFIAISRLNNQTNQLHNTLTQTAQIMQGVSQAFGVFSKDKAASEVSAFFNAMSQGVDAVAKLMKNLDEQDWLSAAINFGVDILRAVGDMTGLYPDKTTVRKEAYAFKTLILDADLEIEKARLDALVLAGGSGTAQYYEQMRTIQRQEHERNMTEIAEQQAEQLDAMIGFWDVVGLIFNGKVTAETQGKQDKIKAAGARRNQAEEIRNQNAQKEIDHQQERDTMELPQRIAQTNADTAAAYTRRTGKAYQGTPKFGDLTGTKLSGNLNTDTLESINATLNSEMTRIINEDASNALKVSQGKMDSKEYDALKGQLTEQLQGAFAQAADQKRTYYKNLDQMELDHQEAQADFLKNGLEKQKKLEDITTERALYDTRERMDLLKDLGLEQSDEYLALQKKEADALAASNKRKTKMEEQYVADVKGLDQDLADARAALTADAMDDFQAAADRQLLELTNLRRQLIDQFPELEGTIDKLLAARRERIEKDRVKQGREYIVQQSDEYRAMLQAQADATDSNLDDIEQEYANTLGSIQDQLDLTLLDYTKTEKQKTIATQKAQADRLKAEKTYREKLKNLAVEELNLAKKIREMAFEAESKARADQVRDFQRQLNELDLQIRTRELSLARLKEKADEEKQELNEGALLRFRQNQLSETDLSSKVRDALKFNDVNISGNPNDAAARQTQAEAVDAYATYLEEMAETDRILDKITSPEMNRQLQQAQLLRATFAQDQIGKVTAYYDEELARMEAAGSTAEELDIHRFKRDKEIEVLRKKYAEAFERYKDLEISVIDEQLKKDSEATEKQLQNDRLKRQSLANSLEEAQIGLDELSEAMRLDMLKIDDAIRKVENRFIGLDTTFQQLKESIEKGFGPAIDAIVAKFEKLDQAAGQAGKSVTSTLSSGGSSGSSSSSGSSGTSDPNITLIKKEKNTGQTRAQMAQKGFHVLWGDYWYETTEFAQIAEKAAGRLAEGAVMPKIPGRTGQDVIGPYMLAPEEEVLSRGNRLSIMDFFATFPDRLERSMQVDQSQNNRSMTIHPTLNNRADVDYFMDRLRAYDSEKSARGANVWGYLAR